MEWSNHKTGQEGSACKPWHPDACLVGLLRLSGGPARDALSSFPRSTV